MPNENPVIKESSLMTKAQQADFRKGVRVATKDYRSSDLVLDFFLNAQSMNYVLTLEAGKLIKTFGVYWALGYAFGKENANVFP